MLWLLTGCSTVSALWLTGSDWKGNPTCTASCMGKHLILFGTFQGQLMYDTFLLFCLSKFYNLLYFVLHLVMWTFCCESLSFENEIQFARNSKVIYWYKSCYEICLFM